MFGWGLSVYLHPLTTSTTHDVLQRFYFSFAVLVPIWLCSALTHGPRLTRKSRSFSAAAGLMVLFLALSVSSSRLLRNSTLTLGMLCVLVQLSAALARGQQSALYLLAGDILTTGLRGLVLLLPSCSGILAESFPLYMLRCARIYDLPFTLGCLVFVSRRYALQFDRTEQLAQELDARVTQRTKALQDASDARKSMMLNIFHDLRSPLFVISSGLDTLEASPEALPALLPILQQRVRFVRGLTEDLFLAAKLEQKQVMLNEDRALLNVLTAAVCTACQTEADQKGVALKVSADCALPVWGDSMRLQQIVQNLVTNAIHYTPAGGQITVACAVQDGQARVSVTDTGCGIAPEDQAASPPGRMTPVRVMLGISEKQLHAFRRCPMLYVTGDLHAMQRKWFEQIEPVLAPGDTLFVCGDFGVGFWGTNGRTEEALFDTLAARNYTVAFVDGNHENFDRLNAFPTTLWHGGRVHLLRPNLVHLTRGSLYQLDGLRLFAFGGGYSLDRARRVEGVSWWPQEMPSAQEYCRARQTLQQASRRVDVILTHTAPSETIFYLSSLHRTGIRPFVPEEQELNAFLSEVQQHTAYQHWYFGHFHTDDELWRRQTAVFSTVRELLSGRIVRQWEPLEE